MQIISRICDLPTCRVEYTPKTKGDSRFCSTRCRSKNRYHSPAQVAKRAVKRQDGIKNRIAREMAKRIDKSLGLWKWTGARIVTPTTKQHESA